MKYISLSSSVYKDKFAIVDDDDYERLMQWEWWYIENGYAVRRENNDNGEIVDVRMHRVVNKTPLNYETDHINGDKLDNRKCNLRNANRSQNTMNTGKREGDYTSKYVGVYWDKTNKNWCVRICSNQKTVNLGRFTNEDAAANAYNFNLDKYHGEFGRPNEVQYMDNWRDYQVKQSSTYRGIYFNQPQNKWLAQIKNPNTGKREHIGYFANEIDGAKAYDKRAFELLGEKSKLNFPVGDNK